MNISLTNQLDGFVKNLVEKGLYRSSSEVIREGLRLLQSREEQRSLALNKLETELSKGLNSGKASPMTKSDWQDLQEVAKQNS